MNLYKSNKVRLICVNGAITQPLRMEYRQTQINAVESGGMTSEELGPSTLKEKILDTAINDRYITKVIQTLFLAGEIL
jgi:uncharacterized protein YacL